MLNYVKRLAVPFLAAAVVLLAGCAVSTDTPPDQQPAQPAQPVVATSPDPTPAQPGSDNITDEVQTAPVPTNRVEVIYFHVNQRCPTCLCFEQRINNVVKTYFSEAISSGKMTYGVFNAQKKENLDIARQYQAVGSQLCINTVIDGQDHIENVIDIWKWDCRYNAPNFDRRVRDVIQDSLEKIRE